MLSRQIRVLRSKIGPQVEANEAYIDQLILNVYTGKGTGTGWIDDLTVDGHVAVPLDQRVERELPSDVAPPARPAVRPAATRPGRVSAPRVE